MATIDIGFDLFVIPICKGNQFGEQMQNVFEIVSVTGWGIYSQLGYGA